MIERITTITASNRLARYLHDQHTQSSANNAESSIAKSILWQTPDIIPWSTWLLRCLKAYQNACFYQGQQVSYLHLLTSHQERLLWQRAINQVSPEYDSLFSTYELAKRAARTWQLVQAWQLPWQKHLWQDTPESATFFEWAEQFQILCDQSQAIEEARWPNVLLSLPLQEMKLLPDTLRIEGFEEYTPQQAALWEYCRQQGVQVSASMLQVLRAQPMVVGLTDTQAEIKQAFLWVKQKLQQNPKQRIAVIVPKLQEMRREIVRVADQMLASDHTDTRAALGLSYNISLGVSLADCPLVHTALDVLAWIAHRTLPLDEACAVLRSPHLGDAERHWDRRARLEREVKDRGYVELSWQHVANREPRFAACLAWWQQQAIPARASMRQWSSLTLSLLQTIGWPGERTCDSEEYQQSQAFYACIQRLASDDILLPELNLTAWLSHLKQAVIEEVFQAESSAQAPVQIMGGLEVFGQSFDAVWVLGLHDQVLPQAPQPDPFIPLALQKKREIPHASAAREHRFAQQLLNHWCAAASDEVVLSYPRQERDTQLLKSPLLSAWPMKDLPTQEASIALETAVFEWFSDDQGPRLISEELPGGSQAFRLQAACPFRAFIRYRMGVQESDEYDLGIKARLKGSWLHAAMEHVWQQICDHASLCALTSHALNALIEQAVMKAAEQLRGLPEESFYQHLLALERPILIKKLQRWFEQEKQRPPFRVKGLEQASITTIAGLKVKLRMDRVDVLEDEQTLIIDYKTGLSTVSSWLGARPDEPQLLLYAMSQAQSIAGLAFAQIKHHGMGWKGLAKQDLGVTGIRVLEDWPSQMQCWEEALTSLACAFKAGDARVDPKEAEKTCRSCGYQAVCRIQEIT